MSERTRYLKTLSPDLLALHEKAEKLVEEGLFKRAQKFFGKLEEYTPQDPYLSERIREIQEREREALGPVADGSRVASGFLNETDSLLKDLLRDLEIDEIRQGYGDLSGELEAIDALDDARFKRVAMDLAVFAGVSNNWHLSLKWTERLQRLDPDSSQARLWRLRCLVELEKFPEAVALFSSGRWSDGELLHANFLVGLAYEGLGVREQAMQRFEAVHKVDPNYRKVAQKLLQY